MAISLSSLQDSVVKRACIYVRISGEGAEEKYSLGEQEAACRQYCLQRGYQVVDVVSEVHSGFDFAGRTRLQSVMALIDARAIDVLVVWRFDRLTRRLWDLAKIVEPCEQQKVALASVTQDIDTSSQPGRMLLTMLVMVAEQERENIRERMQLGKRGRVKSGKPLPGRRPIYGYAWQDDTSDPLHVKRKARLVVNEAEAAIVRRIFREVANGNTLRGIARALDAEGVPVPCPTPHGPNLWHASTVQRICKQPAYWGDLRAYRYRQVRKRKVNEHSGESWWVTTLERRPHEETIALPQAVPPLIDAELAAIVTERLAQNKVEMSRNKAACDPTTTLLRGGFITCGYCGDHFVVTRRSGKNGGPAYRCGRKNHDLPGCDWHIIAASVIDTAVWQHVAHLLMQPDVIKKELRRQRRQDPTQQECHDLDEQLARIRAQQTNLTRLAAMLPNGGDLQPIALQLATLRETERRLEAEHDQVQAQHQSWATVQHRLDDLTTWCQRVASKLDTLTYEQKRMALYALGVKVTVYRREHTPRYVIEANIPLDGALPSPTDEPVVSSTRRD